MKQGGVSWNTSPGSKSGVQTKFKCSVCGRNYKIEQMKDRHQKQCQEYNKGEK